MKTIVYSLSGACLLLSLSAGSFGCTKDRDPRATENAPADNTKKNERDRNDSTLTPVDQGSSDVDRTITQKARQAVVGDSGLSMTAKNVKIITVDGVVTLRGPVKSEQEKVAVASLVQHVEGVKRLDNQLEIASN